MFRDYALMAFTSTIIKQIVSGGNVSLLRCLVQNTTASPTKLNEDFRGIPQRNHSQDLKFVRCRFLTHPSIHSVLNSLLLLPLGFVQSELL